MSSDEERLRLESLRRYRVLDTPAEPGLDRVVRTAALLLDAPAAVIALADSQRVWFKARHGIQASAIQGRSDLLARLIRDCEPLTVEDLRADPATGADGLLAVAADARAMAAVPLVDPDGRAIGALCVLDTRTGSPSASRMNALADLAALVMDYLAMRQAALVPGHLRVPGRPLDPALELAEALPQVIWSATPDGGVDYANRAFSDYTGMAKATLTPDDWMAVVAEEDRHGCVAVWGQCVLAGTPYRHEFRIWSVAHRQHRWHLVSATPIRDDHGRVVRWYGNAVDIHDRKLAEQALADREQRLRTILDSEPECVKLVSADGRLLDMNPAGLRLIDVDDLSRVVDRPVLELIDPLDHQAFWGLHERALRGEAGRLTFRIIGAGGARRQVESYAAPLPDRDGTIRAVLSVTRDVTRQRELEEHLRQSQRLESVGQLTGGVAHDFNNLLTVILGNADVLVEQLATDETLRRLAEMTRTAAQRGAELTSRLLAFARRQALDPTAVDVGRLLSGMDELLRRTLGAHIEIELVRGGGLWPAMVDAAQLENAVLNLCLNARDAMPEGGRLTIETANARLDADYAAAHEEVSPGQYLMLAVSDTGVGMSPEVAARAFDPFFTTKDVGKGSGLGLSMVYGFVKQSSGHVKIYSEPHQGTTVRIYLPRASSPAAADDAVEMAATPGGSECILLVEDDELVRAHVKAQLRMLGYRVVDAGNAAQALAVLDGEPQVDLLFTDVIMPGGMNGAVLADAALHRRPGLRVLFTSGYTENAIVHQGRLDPGVHLLAKPYRRDELALKVRQVLDQPKPRA